MDNPGLPDALWAILDGRLWHATSPAGLQGIMSDGAIRIVGHRYASSFCRAADSVSLLDFGPAAAHFEHQFDNWFGWFGRQQDCRIPVWIEIDRSAVAPNLLDAGEARQRWRAQLAAQPVPFGMQIIPGVEACHRGPLPISSIRSVLLIDRHDHSHFRQTSGELKEVLDAFAVFERDLAPAPPENPLAKAWREADEARERAQANPDVTR